MPIISLRLVVNKAGRTTGKKAAEGYSALLADAVADL